MRSAIVINPKSASGNTIRMWREVQASVQRRLGGVEIFMTEYPGHASVIATQLAEKKYDRLIIMGGDGSIHEVINGLIDDNDRVINPELKIGILNSGRGCDFIRSLEIPTDHNEAITKLVEMHTKPVDVGVIKVKRDGDVETQYFINSFSYGLGGEVARSIQRNETILTPTASYFIASVLGFLRCKPFLLDIELPHQDKVTKECMNVFAMNGRFSGGGMNWAPKGQLDDGLLDLVIVEKMSKFKLATIAPKVYDGTFVNVKEVSYQQVERVKMHAPEDLWVEMDGEVMQAQEIELSVIPRALEFIC